MLRALSAVVWFVALLGADSTAAPQVRSSSTSEITQLLIGCWDQQITARGKQLELRGYFNSHELCFTADGKVEMWSVGSSKFEIEGFEARGRYYLSGGRLHLRGDLDDGWLFEVASLSCDVLVVPGLAIKLYRCQSTEKDGKSLPNMTFSRKKSG